MATKAELKALVIDKISIAGTKSTTGVKVRQLMDNIIDALFDQFPQWNKQIGVNLVSMVDYEIEIPDSASKAVANVDIFDSSGYKLEANVLVKRSFHSGTGNILITLNSPKTQTNLEVNTLMT